MPVSAAERERDLDALLALVDGMGDETYGLWEYIGRRLAKGEKDYGGFKFGSYDLNTMKLEELADWVVYNLAISYLKELK